MYGVRLLGVRRLMLSMAKMARVDVGLDDAQPNLLAQQNEERHSAGIAGHKCRESRASARVYLIGVN